MTPELRAAVEKVARAMREQWRDDNDIRHETLEFENTAPSDQQDWLKDAFIAIRAVAEATREATEAVLIAGNDAEPTMADNRTKPPFYPTTRARWRAMHAASILGEALSHE
jgi:hypothetical protein